MGSPQNVVFFAFTPSTGAPLTGQAGNITFDTYKDSSGNNLAQPAITEVGGGAYQFTPVFADPTKSIAFVINLGAAANNQRLSGFVRPEDYYEDLIQAMSQYQQGSWEIKNSGPDANRMIIYAPDGVTVLFKYNLTDAGGNPVTTGVYKRTKQ